MINSSQVLSTERPDGCMCLSLRLVGRIISSEAATGPATAMETNAVSAEYLAFSPLRKSYQALLYVGFPGATL